MATKEQVTEYVNGQFDENDPSNWEYWEKPVGGGIQGTRISLVQNWMSPEIAGILQKLVGDAIMVGRIAKNRSNV
jgi:hypothetical protein|tara:strand:- start:247 stop:471 length:225 start_codon:yes stop_codon:yes gene_type:complete